ncbi:hypothetical protein K490DRAFT_68852 [Saccharata proteae CBS 121410]|uniref:RGS domain-containing protein n=1 Tax=Saccharata proteae CBS 121410 TaxID=1314787 RepID=A0A9P4HMJ6_9PEZI|nr:hypothetical protein K490DRAFT_68852 [Saccharata proteae CBS 121410]
MSVLFYRRPEYVEKYGDCLNPKDCQKYVERTAGGKRGIPEELSFDRIIANKTLPPCSLRDFMDYLVYVTRDAENLQFFLWYQDYSARFNALKKERQNLAPEWTAPENPEQHEYKFNTQSKGEKKGRKKKPSPLVPNFNFDNPADARAIGLDDIIVSPTSPKTRGGRSPSPNPLSPGGESTFEDTYRAMSPTFTHGDSYLSAAHPEPQLTDESVREMNDEANVAAGLKWQAFTVQPLRPEIEKVIAHYIAPGSPRELNLSAKERSAVLHALQHTTHPSAFKEIVEMIESTLRGHAHPNFVRWAICNGNKPRVFFVRSMGVIHTFFGILIGLLLALSSASRWWRIMLAPMLFIGLTTLVAAYKGLCVILHHSHNRTLRPWEDMSDDSASMSGGSGIHGDRTPTKAKVFDDDEEMTLHSSRTEVFPEGGSELRRPWTMDTFGSSNSFESDSWVSTYKRKSVARKVFDRQTWVQEESVRIMQDTIVRQSQAWAGILTFAVTVLFVAVPKGKLY